LTEPKRHPNPASRGSATTGGTLLLLASLLVASLAAAPVTSESEEPRILVLALDGVPYRAVVDAIEQGAFDGWPAPKAMVSTFPSMTNVSFTAMLMPLGVEPIGGYEVRHFNPDENKISSGITNYDETHFGWRDRFQVTLRKKKDKVSNYVKPRRTFWKMLGWVEDLVLNSDTPVMLAHVGSADVIGHYHSGDGLTPFMVEVSDWTDELVRRHEEVHGSGLRLILLSDHGNSTGKVLHSNDVLDRLGEAGLRINKKLEQPGDVVAPAFGVVNFGVLYLRQDKAEQAARAVAGDPSVDLAAWISGQGQLTVVGRGAEARVRWRGEGAERRFAYEPVSGDPLLLEATVEDLEQLGLTDGDGYASAEAWFNLTAFKEFPDAPRRLVDSLTGTYVDPPATVIFSLDPGHAMGLWSAKLGVRLVTGHLLGTHGGLDRDSTLGFYLSNDPDQPPGIAVTAEETLLTLLPHAPLPVVWPPERAEEIH
jgi:hypothetical protein